MGRWKRRGLFLLTVVKAAEENAHLSGTPSGAGLHEQLRKATAHSTVRSTNDVANWN